MVVAHPVTDLMLRRWVVVRKIPRLHVLAVVRVGHTGMILLASLCQKASERAIPEGNKWSVALFAKGALLQAHASVSLKEVPHLRNIDKGEEFFFASYAS